MTQQVCAGCKTLTLGDCQALRHWRPQNEGYPKKEDNPKNENELKNWDHHKNKDVPENEDYLKNEDDLKNENNLKTQGNIRLIFFIGEVSLQKGCLTAVVLSALLHYCRRCQYVDSLSMGGCMVWCEVKFSFSLSRAWPSSVPACSDSIFWRS